MKKILLAIFLNLIIVGQCFATDPLYTDRNFTYLGSFRVPHNDNLNTGQSFAYGGRGISYNPAHDSLFMVGYNIFNYVAEIGYSSDGRTNTGISNIPLNSSWNTLGQLSYSTYLKNDGSGNPTSSYSTAWADITEGKIAGSSWGQSPAPLTGQGPGGLGCQCPQPNIFGTLVYNNLLYAAYGCNYDTGAVVGCISKGNPNACCSGPSTGSGCPAWNGSFGEVDDCSSMQLFTHSLSIGTTGTYTGMYSDGGTSKYMPGDSRDGYMGSIPNGISSGSTTYQQQLGGDTLIGEMTSSDVSVTSCGPAVESLTLSRIGNAFPTPGGTQGSGYELLVYPETHQTLAGPWGNSMAGNSYNSNSDEVSGVVFPQNSRSVIFFGRHGDASSEGRSCCYGIGVTNVAEDNIYQCADHPTEGELCCYDPANPSIKASHCYPYKAYVWFYDVGNPDGTNSPGNTAPPVSGYTGTPTAGYNTLTAVKLGIVLPWNIYPYYVAPLTDALQDPNNMNPFAGAAYDSSRGLLYLSVWSADGGNGYPLIDVFKVGNSSTTYSIQTSAGTGGTLYCSPDPVNQGSSSVCTATANSGYTFASISDSGCNTGTISGNTDTVTPINNSCVVSASFTSTSTPTINTTGANCSFSPGSETTLGPITITAPGSVTGATDNCGSSGTPCGSLSGSTYSLSGCSSIPSSNCTVTGTCTALKAPVLNTPEGGQTSQ